MHDFVIMNAMNYFYMKDIKDCFMLRSDKDLSKVLLVLVCNEFLL